LEFSLYAQVDDRDFASEAAHLDELMHYIQRVESRSVFTRIAAELDGEQFVFSDRLISHLPALTTRDKPLYKLCQGSSYATRLIHLLSRRGQGLELVTAKVIAVTSAGLEALSARFEPNGEQDYRARLMRALGDAYRRAGSGRDDSSRLNDEIRAVQAQVARSLPTALREAFDETLEMPPTDRSLEVRGRERVSNFTNPAAPVQREQLLRWLDDTPSSVDPLLGGNARTAVRAELDQTASQGPAVSLRDLHGATIRAALRAAVPGQITVIAAEGHPGIGKTTAVREFLAERRADEGYLFVYASPRLVINSDVTRRVARDEDDQPTGVLTLTTNSRLIGAAPRWWIERQRTHGQQLPIRWVDGAVVIDGVAGFHEPPGSIVFLDPETAAQLDEDFASNRLRKHTWAERDDVLRNKSLPGVLLTLAHAARGALDANPTLNRAVLSVAIQGFRDTAPGTSTVARLSNIFVHPADSARGLQERRVFAGRMPLIVVMIDEIAGDGAGSPFVHAAARWLHQEFIAPFAANGQTSPMTVAFVLADASLANETVLANYLANEVEAPERVLVSNSAGPRPFRMSAGHLRLGGRSLPVLHVMSDGFPAGRLEIDYHVRLTPVMSHRPTVGAPVSARIAIREQQGEALQRQAVEEVFAAIAVTPPDQQVVLFAQDKYFLRAVRHLLLHPDQLTDTSGNQAPVDTRNVVLDDEDIGLLDGSVASWERRRLMEPRHRDSKRVFLMTSSGSRGVSFPLATTIVAFVPRFAIESGFMEIAQVVYRGRGFSDLRGIDGDGLDHRIVLLLQDFVVADEPVDDRTWLRRKIDLISALVLLRATLLTRMTGDAGIPRQRAAVVPVGRIGTDELGTSLSAGIAAFLREGNIYLADTVAPYLRKLVEQAIEDTDVLFRDFRWTVRSKGNQATIAACETMAQLRIKLCAAVSPLLPDGGVLPEQAYGVGPVVFERWGQAECEEAFRFDALVERQRERKRRLVDGCRQISWRSDLPGTLRRAARDVLTVLVRSEDLQELDFVVRKAIDTRTVWACLPVDYVRFCRASVDEEHSGTLQEPAAWLEGLGRAASAAVPPTAVSPVLPYYRAHPYAALAARGDVTGLSRVFDDRYFMASNELNLLNAILFVANER
jgi:hypothetical protein